MPAVHPPFPASGAFVRSVRESSKAAREASGISISEPAVDAFLRSLSRSEFHRLKSQHGISFPLRFSSLSSEVNFLSLLALLNTLSGYRLPFHSATGRGAYQNVIKLMLGLYISSTDENGAAGTGALSAQGLTRLTAQTVAEILQVSLHEESAHESIPGLVVGLKGGPVNEAVELIVRLCNETGERLAQSGYPDLGALVLEILKEAESVRKEGGEEAAADLFIEKLVRAIPGFQDMALIDGVQPVYIFKKAFFLLFSLHVKLSEPSSESGKSVAAPRIPDARKLPMFVDNVLPTMLVHLGIVDLSRSLSDGLRAWAASKDALSSSTSTSPAQSVQQAAQTQTQGKEGTQNQNQKLEVIEGPNLSLSDAYVVRAASIDGGVAVVRRAKELAQSESAGEELRWLAELTEVDLDGYLWSVAKDDPALRNVPRMVERGTIMY